MTDPDAPPALSTTLRELAQVHRHRAALRTHRDTKAEHRRTATALEQAAARLEALEAVAAALRELLVLDTDGDVVGVLCTDRLLGRAAATLCRLDAGAAKGGTRDG